MDGEGAPAADGTRSSGVVKERSIRDLAGIAEDLSTAGWSVVEGILGADTVSVACERLDVVFDSEADVAAERGWLTDTYRVSYALAAKDRLFVDLCTDPRVLEVVRAVLGSDARVAGCNGFDLLPGGPAQDLHRDHPDPTPGSTLYLHVVVALDAFTEVNGATRVVPASHSRTDLRGESPRDGQSAQGRGSDGRRPRDTTPRDAEVLSVEVPVGGWCTAPGPTARSVAGGRCTSSTAGRGCGRTGTGPPRSPPSRLRSSVTGSEVCSASATVHVATIRSPVEWTAERSAAVASALTDGAAALVAGGRTVPTGSASRRCARPDPGPSAGPPTAWLSSSAA